MNGAAPLSYLEIDAWKRLTQRPLSPRDIDTIMKLDRAYLGAINE